MKQNQMIRVMNRPLSFRVLSIDPGFTMLGASVSILDYHQLTQEVLFSDSFPISKMDKQHTYTGVDTGTSGLINTSTVRTLVSNLLSEYQPDIIVCEATYLSRFPQAYAALTLCLNAIETAVFAYDSDVGFYTFDPATVKVSMGVKGSSSIKEDMRDALLINPRILSNLDLSILDEHAVDSICVGHCYFKWTAQF